MDVGKNFGTVISFSLISTILLSVMLFFYVANHDYLFIEIYDIGENFVDNDLMSVSFLDGIENVFLEMQVIPQTLDILWLLSFIMLVIGVWRNSYFADRLGYFSIVSLLTYGVMVFLFLSSIFYQISDWLFDVFIKNLLNNYSFAIPFFSFYLENYGLINAIIITIALILNFVDFDFSKFTTRKDKEKEEIV